MEKLTTGQGVLLGAVVEMLVPLRVGLVEITLIEHRCVDNTLTIRYTATSTLDPMSNRTSTG